MSSKKKSLHFVSGLALGTAVAAGAAFLYKTKKGKKVRKLFAGHYDDAKGYLDNLVKDVKQQAKKLEKNMDKSNQVVAKKTKTVKKKVTDQTDSAVDTARRVFKRLGKPLLK